MIFIILGAVIAFVLILFADYGYSRMEGLLPALGGAFIGGLLGLMFAGLVTMTPLFDTTQEDTYKLAAMKDTTSTSGRFFLGSGSFNDTPSFSFYQVDGDSYSLQSVLASKSKVKYTDGEPRLVVESNCASIWIDPLTSGCHPSSYTFYVPEGSVKNQFVLDAQ